MELSDLQKRVEALEALTNQLAQWVGFNLDEELKVKDEDEKEVRGNKGRGLRRKRRRKRGVAMAKKLTSGLHKKVKDTEEDEEDLINYDDDSAEADTSLQEYSGKGDDAIGVPDFETDVDFPLILPTSTSGINIKEEPDSDFDEYIQGYGDSLEFPSSSMKANDKAEEEDNVNNGCSPVSEPLDVTESYREPYSLRNRNRPQSCVKLGRISCSTLNERELTALQKRKGRPSLVTQWNCKKCHEVFGKRIDLRQHRQEVHPQVKWEWEGPLICPHCPEETRKPFKIASDLQAHIRLHTGETPFQCPVCGRGFRLNGQLKQHMNFIHPEKPREPFECPKCGKLFYSKLGIKRHMLSMHTEGGNPLAVQCDKCFIVFASKDSLKLHMRAIHENRRDFSCHICGQLFKKHYVLKQHVERHKNPKMRKRGPELVPRARGKPVPPLEPKDIQNQGIHHGHFDFGPQPQPAIALSTIPHVPSVATETVQTETLKSAEAQPLNLGNSSSPPTTMNHIGTMNAFNIDMLQTQGLDGYNLLSSHGHEEI